MADDGAAEAETIYVHQTWDAQPDDIKSPQLPDAPFTFQRQTLPSIDDYFTGPQEMDKPSKWTLLLQMHGSILSKLILPLLYVALWSAAITVVTKKVHSLGANPALFTITGFIAGLGLFFRNAAAYKGYVEGRKYWARLLLASHVLGRVFWIHGLDPPNLDSRESFLKKLTSMSLLVAFAISLRHSLRFKSYTAYPNLQNLTSQLNTIAEKAATEYSSSSTVQKKYFFKGVGEYLSIFFAASNPQTTLRTASQPLSNLPHGILNHIKLTIDRMVRNGQLRVPMLQALAYNNLSALYDTMIGCTHLVNTPIPVAYTIAGQITWVYVILLPFQLVILFEWITIPVTVAASYFILGMLFISQEMENLIGQDVEQLPLYGYCAQIAAELDVIASYDMQDPNDVIAN